MSNIKVGDKVKVEFDGVVIDEDNSNYPFKIGSPVTQGMFWLNDSHITKIEPQEEQAKVNKFKVGDRVTFKATIVGVDRDQLPYRVKFDFAGGCIHWLDEEDMKSAEVEPEPKFKAGDLVIAYPNIGMSPVIGKVRCYDEVGRVQVAHLEDENWQTALQEDRVDHIQFRDNKGESDERR